MLKSGIAYLLKHVTRPKRILNAKFNRCDILLVGLGGPTPRKKNYKVGTGRVLCSCYDGFTRNSFRAPKRQVETRETGSQEMAEAWPAENVRTNLAASYQGIPLRCAAEVGVWCLNKISVKKSTTNKCTFWCCSLTKKVALWDLLLDERYIAAGIESRRPVLGLW